MDNNEKIILKVAEVEKFFAINSGNLTILNGVSFSVKAGEKVAIIGPSGSGKSTLLSLIGLLDEPSAGKIIIDNQNINELSEVSQADFRNKKIGFIFQSFELISSFTVWENIVAPLDIADIKPDKNYVDGLIKKLGLESRVQALPNTLSGGEKQRVAIGRALVNNPALILADEPTGSLDRITGERVLDMLIAAVTDSGSSLIIITHDESLADKMDRVFELRDKTIHERN
jgi:putative ABC transport system ATP-binding protein